MKALATFLNWLLGHMGLKIIRVRPGALNSVSFEDVFHRLRRSKVRISTVIDVGASNGCWSLKVREYFPDCRYHLIEANVTHVEALNQFVEDLSGASFTLAAASGTVGEIYFDDSDPWTGVAMHKPADVASKKVASTTVDEEVRQHQLSGPFLLKLDTHGFEVPILQGADQALRETNVLVIETYNFSLGDECLTFWQICAWLKERGFRPADILEPMHRPKDGLLWQTDIVFLRADRPEFDDNRYD